MDLWPENETYLNEYKHYLQVKKEASTVKVYLAEVKEFILWLQSRNKKINEMTREDLLDCRDELANSGHKISTINKWISSMSSFFKWAISKNYLNVNFAEQLRFLIEKKEKPHWLNAEEALLLMAQAGKERNPFKKARNEALVYIFLFAGLRIEEVSSLMLTSIDHGELVISDERGRRRVPIIPELQVKLLEWLKHRSQSSKPIHQDSPFLFVTERSGKMQPRAIQFVIEGYSQKLGYTVTCQMLRHTFCRRLVEKGVPLQQIKSWAGHKSMQSTIRYLDE